MYKKSQEAQKYQKQTREILCKPGFFEIQGITMALRASWGAERLACICVLAKRHYFIYLITVALWNISLENRVLLLKGV